MKESSTKDIENENERDLVNAMKVVHIMQVVSEDLGDGEKRMWRKMLGIKDTSIESSSNRKEVLQEDV